jgi:aminodeoxyfutalosine deaminase
MSHHPPTPKIELHVHLEGTVRPRALLAMANRNGVRLPAESEEALAELYVYRDFPHFLELWSRTTCALQTARDFQSVVVDYATEAAAQGAVYLEGIFSPAERVQTGASWDEVFSGFCDGAMDAWERTGVVVRLTCDTPRHLGLEPALETARYCVKYRERGVVGLGLGGPEEGFPPEPFAAAFRRAREGGVGSVPHAGEVVGPLSVRGALDALGADRIRHGIRAADDPALLDELADRGVVCDVCPVSNVRTGAVSTLDVHPLPRMVAAGVACSIGTDDPAMFGTDLLADYAAAERLGVSAEAAFAAGVQGALCGEDTKERLRAIGAAFPWRSSRPVVERTEPRGT